MARLRKLGMQVVALGNGKFDSEGYPGGLPGDGWNKEAGRRHRTGETKDGVTTLSGESRTARIENGVVTIADSDGKKIGELKRVERKSPTLGAKPPAGAIVLFDGTSADKWNGGRLTDDGLLVAGCTSKQSFKDFQLHIEFQTPFMPKRVARDAATAASTCRIATSCKFSIRSGWKGRTTSAAVFTRSRRPT